MTIGISKERLKELLKHFDRPYCMAEFTLISNLINECTELNPWMPIDENAPKDRPLLLKANCGVAVEGSFNGWNWEEHLLHTEIRPTHYQELPEDPV